MLAMRLTFVVFAGMFLGACESASERAVKMEMQDDAACQRLASGKSPEPAVRTSWLIVSRLLARMLSGPRH